MLLSHWGDLDDSAKALLGLKPKDEVPVREKFVVAGGAVDAVSDGDEKAVA